MSIATEESFTVRETSPSGGATAFSFRVEVMFGSQKLTYHTNHVSVGTYAPGWVTFLDEQERKRNICSPTIMLSEGRFPVEGSD